MDGHRFDALVRSFAGRRTRRRVLGGLVGSALGAIGLGGALAAARRGPDRACRKTVECVDGARCLADARGRLTCRCNAGLKACGERCIPAAACCGDKECAGLTTPCARGVCGEGQCQAIPFKNGRTCPTGVCCNGGCVACCNGVGNCGPCQAATDCPGQDAECRKRSCTAGVCGFTNLAANTSVAAQTAGDCKRRVCDGQGGVILIADDSDLPADDGNQCTSDLCANGTAVHRSLPARTACAQEGGSFCDGQGHCVECLTLADCPGEDTVCQSRVCVAGFCDVFNVDAGTPVTNQQLGDCRRDVCAGNGSVTTIVDDEDLPTSDDPCLVGTCLDGVVSYPAAAFGESCGDDMICDGSGGCISLAVEGEPCDSWPLCLSGDCVDGVCCDSACDGLCEACTAERKGDGDDGVCGYIAAGADLDDECPGDSTCDGAGRCTFVCQTGTDCPGEDTECQRRTCESGLCGFIFVDQGTPLAAQTPGDCKQAVCDGLGGAEVVDDDTDLPLGDGTPCQTVQCVDGQVVRTTQPVGTECSGSPSIKICNSNGECVAQGFNGAPCTLSVECKSDTCVDGYCCNSICSATCRACNVPDHLGDCVIAPGSACNENGGNVCNSDAQCIAV